MFRKLGFGLDRLQKYRILNLFLVEQENLANVVCMKTTALILVQLVSWSVFAWGPVGHRTVGLIADANLTPIARTSVQQLLGGQKLADVVNWADEIKSGTTYLQTHYYHFENIPDRVNYLQHLQVMPPAQRALGGVVEAIISCRDILRSPMRGLADKAVALKFISHFIGDIHQPLHTGRPEDKGGVLIDVTWFGTPMSLHSIWDSGMLFTGHSDILNPQQTPEQSSIAYAQYLVHLYAGRFIFVSSDIDTWTNESMVIRPEAYNPLYTQDQKRYQSIHMVEIDQRILMAGLRLADTLNHIFANAPIPAPEVTFRQQIESIVGDINRLISFRP